MAFFNIISLLAGLVFFLFGMSTMSASLEKLAGSKLEVILKNGYTDYVSRRQMKNVKERLGIK